MFGQDFSQLFKPFSDGRYGDIESMDMMLNYDNNELMSSDFFDTIRSVETDIQKDGFNTSTDGFFTSSGETDGFITSSDSSSHVEGCISPRNDASESERSSIYNDYNDESISSPRPSMESVDESLLDFLTPIKTQFQTQTIQTTPITTPQIVVKGPTQRRIIIQNPNNKKIITKQIVNPNQLKKVGKKQILKVQSLTTTDGKPVILPCGLKSIKILNVNDLKTDRIHVTTLSTGNVCRRKVEAVKQKLETTDTSIDIQNKLSEVILTQEEKRLLDKEGIQLPTYHPLSKLEDRELKRIRRKIRNKISAQDSRKRKKEYVDGLEERVRRGSEENKNLMQRVKELQKKNKNLMAHINKLQSLIFNSSSTKATPSTCLMIVMLSVLLVSLPNIRLSKTNNNNKDIVTTNNEDEAFSVSRSLLSTKKTMDDDTINMEEFFIFNKDETNSEFNKYDDENDVENVTVESEFFRNMEEFNSKYDNDHGKDENFLDTFLKNVRNLWDGKGWQNKKGFIEPDIDDFSPTEPIMKKMKIDYTQNDEHFLSLNNIVSVQSGETKNK